MNLEEAMDSTVTYDEAVSEIQKHSCSVDEFIQEVGTKPEYKGSQVLHWLGY